MDQHEQIQGSTYSNLVLRCAIRFPEGWKIQDGDGQAVVKQAFGPNRSAINITVTQAVDAFRTSNEVTDRLLKGLAESTSQSLLIQLAGQVIERSLGEINGQRFAFCKVKADDLDHASGRTPMVFQNIATFKHGLIYMVTACFKADNEAALDPHVKNTFASFVIGD